MMKSTLLWIIAVIITVASAVYQRKTGPTYPLSGHEQIGGQTVNYSLIRSYDVGDQPVRIEISDPKVSGMLVYKRYKSADDWTRKEMSRENNFLVSSLPHQPPAGKLIYYIELIKDENKWLIPAQGQVITRFKGPVPTAVLLPHILFMFGAMLLSTRTGLAALSRSTHVKGYMFWTIGLMFLGGMIFGPIMQKYAFDAYWTGVPFGYDLTDNKTLIAFMGWLIALWAIYKRPSPLGWVVAASLITFIIFMIPHSVLGSELDYSKLPANSQSNH